MFLYYIRFGQVWYLIVSIPDLCNLTYFVEYSRQYNAYFLKLPRVDLVACDIVMKRICPLKYSLSATAKFLDMAINVIYFLVYIYPIIFVDSHKHLCVTLSGTGKWHSHIKKNIVKSATTKK